MKTKEYFELYPTIEQPSLHCRLCDSPIQVVQVSYDDLHYRCSNKLCTRHEKGETADLLEYPSEWITAVEQEGI
jgi:hypothetical protein